MAKKKKELIEFRCKKKFYRVPAPNISGYREAIQFEHGKYSTDDEFLIKYLQKFEEVIMWED
ncbi:MAG: hypothetical protein E7E88_15265 [Clostridium perfringens]|uniref:hypothetical protein n=1 Tax=Veillonella sp. TaxID=1926307 RepID=UPI0029040DD9|nr:hypothetical protein [Veillonella sp.]MDU2094795.1 hypothetical protein [Clostridium perfringens]MDU2102701.1 hypothetical protein [Veillonella sp.]